LSEADLQRQIIQYLRARGMPAWLTHDSRHHPVEPGIADINCILPGGRFLAIECKTDTGKLSPEQLEWFRVLESGSGNWCIVHSLDEAMATVKAFEG
jgi:hypothetical protein